MHHWIKYNIKYNKKHDLVLFIALFVVISENSYIFVLKRAI
jgi:hypothetical protein